MARAKPTKVVGVTGAMVKVATPGMERPYHHVHVPYGHDIPECDVREYDRLASLGVFDPKPQPWARVPRNVANAPKAQRANAPRVGAPPELDDDFEPLPTSAVAMGEVSG